MRSDPGLTAPITPAPQIPANSQRLVSRLPLLLEVDRAYIARVSPDGVRFTVTQASRGDWPDLLGYTQSAARLPAFARGAIKSGVQATIDDALTFPFTPQQRIWDFLVLDACRSLAAAIGARLALSKLGDHLVTDERDPIHDMQSLNVMANVAHLLETSDDPGATSAEIVEALEALHFVVSLKDGVTHVGLALLNEGERFGGIELELMAPDPKNARWVSDACSAFVRTVTEQQMPVSLQERR